MPRKRFTIDPCCPYHLVARTNNKEWFTLSMPKAWEIFSDYLAFIHFAYGVRIHSFVLMNNHFHLIASFPEANLSAAMNYFMRETSRVIGFEAARINHVYGTRVFRSRLSSFHYFEHAYKYSYRNPVEAGLCERVEEYPFSTLHGLLGMAPITIPMEEDTLLFRSQGFEEHMKWLNSRPEADAKEAIRRALKRPNFELPKVTTTKRMNPLEEVRY